MRAVNDPNSTISAFLREHLPHIELCLHLWRRDLQRHSKRYQSALGITGSIGRAIEMRIGFDLSPHPVYTDMTSMLPDGQEAELWSMLGYHPAPTGELTRDTERVTALYTNNIEYQHFRPVAAPSLVLDSRKYLSLDHCCA